MSDSLWHYQLSRCTAGVSARASEGAGESRAVPGRRGGRCGGGGTGGVGGGSGLSERLSGNSTMAQIWLF